MFTVQVVPKNTPKTWNCSHSIETLCSLPSSADCGLKSHSCKLLLQKNIFFHVWANKLKHGMDVGWRDSNYSPGSCRSFQEVTVLYSPQNKTGSRTQPRRGILEQKIRLLGKWNFFLPSKIVQRTLSLFQETIKAEIFWKNVPPSFLESVLIGSGSLSPLLMVQQV